MTHTNGIIYWTKQTIRNHGNQQLLRNELSTWYAGDIQDRLILFSPTVRSDHTNINDWDGRNRNSRLANRYFHLIAFFVAMSRSAFAFAFQEWRRLCTPRSSQNYSDGNASWVSSRFSLIVSGGSDINTKYLINIKILKGCCRSPEKWRNHHTGYKQPLNPH